MRIYRLVLILFATTILSLNFAGKSFSQTTENSTEIVVLQPVQYKVNSRYDNLYRISKRFGVPMSQLLSPEVNPQLALRKNPDLLYRGETIAIPVYSAVSIPSNKADSFDKVVLTSAELIKKDKLLRKYSDDAAKLQQDNFILSEADSKNRATIKVLLFLIGWLVLIMVLVRVFLHSEDDRSTDKKLLPQDLNSAVSFADSSPEEILAALRTAKGKTLVIINQLTIATDESNNPVRLPNLAKYLDKPERSHLADTRVEDWTNSNSVNVGGFTSKEA